MGVTADTKCCATADTKCCGTAHKLHVLKLTSSVVTVDGECINLTLNVELQHLILSVVS